MTTREWCFGHLDLGGVILELRYESRFRALNTLASALFVVFEWTLIIEYLLKKETPKIFANIMK